jgi:hypothetical protein
VIPPVSLLRAHLVNEVLAVVVTQILRPDHSMEIRLHQLLDEVDFLEALKGGRLHDVENRNDLETSLSVSAMRRRCALR